MFFHWSFYLWSKMFSFKGKRTIPLHHPNHHVKGFKSLMPMDNNPLSSRPQTLPFWQTSMCYIRTATKVHFPNKYRSVDHVEQLFLTPAALSLTSDKVGTGLKIIEYLIFRNQWWNQIDPLHHIFGLLEDMYKEYRDSFIFKFYQYVLKGISVSYTHLTLPTILRV